MRPCLVLVALAALAPTALAHGDLAVHELETLTIRDFEGMEDSFPWGGFEIWDVYVGEGYNESLESDGVYFKVNFAGDGSRSPAGGSAWTITFRFMVEEEAFERQLTHDGESITTTFESLQWVIADGNVLQVKAWVPVTGWAGKSLHDVVIVSSVDDEPRDTAPGGVHAPGSGAEVPVHAPGTPIFPPMGEGRLVEEVPLTGPGKLLNVTVAPTATGGFTVTVANALKEQGQHVFLRPLEAEGWNVTLAQSMTELAGGASAVFDVTFQPAEGVVPPMRLDVVSDIGARQTLHAFMGTSGVELVADAAQVVPASLPEGTNETPMLSAGVLVATVAALAVGLGTRRSP